MISENPVHPASFRDPSGFIFEKNGTLYRQVNQSYKDNYDLFLSSGLYQTLLEKDLIVTHKEVDQQLAQSAEAYKIIQPDRIPFLSYPYEWCFTELKDAAITTLSIQKIALEHGMVLKDASAYNIQFVKGRPVLIDTLSFEKYSEGEPWIAYRQFCQNFLAPLSLMSFKDIRLNQLFRVYIDGVPLDLASSLLPFRTRLKLPIATHIHLHAKSQKHYADRPVNKQRSRPKVGRLAFKGLMDHLRSSIEKLHWSPSKTEWRDYYENTNYSSEAIEDKKRVLIEFLDQVKAEIVWDLGANTGLFSRLASMKGMNTIAFDIDPAAVEINYLECKKNSETKLLPLLLDLTNPSPAIGFANKERESLLQRGPADLVLALAFIHHLAISNNVPLARLAEFFVNVTKILIIEFVPKCDSQVQRLLASREDIFTDYNQQTFEKEFGRFFKTLQYHPIKATERTLYLMQNRSKP